MDNDFTGLYNEIEESEVDAMTIGEKIRQLRKGKGLTQDAVVSALEISRQAIAKWESNQSSPSTDNLVKLAALFDVSLEELVDVKRYQTPALEEYAFQKLEKEQKKDKAIAVACKYAKAGAVIAIVIIENLDRVIDIDDEKKAQNKFYRIASKTEKHLALTFHRFIEEDNLILELNGTPIKAWNPFILENSATQELPEESIFSDNGCAEVTIQPYVLPHKTKFATDDDYQAAGGPKGWNYHQGIYVNSGKSGVF